MLHLRTALLPEPIKNFEKLCVRDNYFMARAMHLAISLGREVSPNPCVGAVLVSRSGLLIGEGSTQEDGGAHAEVMAFRSVAATDLDLLPTATLYVTLEPCSIHGRTPPCVDLIIRHGIARVVVGCVDFTPGVCGRGLELLRHAGIEVTIGVQQQQAFYVSRFRQATVRYHRPYITLKQAISENGYVGNAGSQVAITGPLANAVSHRWRAESDAILVGVGTVIIDDPSLTTRLVKGPSPLRVVLDPRARARADATVFSDGLPTLRAIDDGIEPAHTRANVEVIALEPSDRLNSLLAELQNRRIGRLLVEGGPSTLRRFVEANLWDEYREWRSPLPLPSSATQPISAAQITGYLEREAVIGEDALRIVRRLPL